MNIKPRQVRAARALLGMTQKQLADKSNMAASTLADFEREERASINATVSSLKSTLEALGIEFVDGGVVLNPKVPTELPMQPIAYDRHGVIRFKENRIVRHLLDFATEHGCSLNELARMDFTLEERMQLAQLIGYSVSGYGDLGYASKQSVSKADELAEKLYQEKSESSVRQENQGY